LQSARPFVRREVSRRLKLRSSPTIEFFLDHSIERGTKLLALMKELGLGEPPEEEPAAPGEEEPAASGEEEPPSGAGEGT